MGHFVKDYFKSEGSSFQYSALGTIFTATDRCGRAKKSYTG